MARLLHPLTVATPQPAAASPVRHLVLAGEHLQQIVQQGKARYLGFSEWTPMQIRAAIEIAGPDLFVSSQPQPKIEG